MNKGPEMPTMMNHEKVLENEMVLSRIIAERDQFILMLINSTRSQSNQIQQLEAKIKELKGEAVVTKP
jgi:hypothetical protein